MRDHNGHLPAPIQRDASDIASEPVILHHFLDLYAAGQCVILRRPLLLAQALSNRVHVSICRAFATWKALKPLGRIITDYRDNGVNGPSTSAAQHARASAAASTLGPIHSATVAQVCCTLIACAVLFGTSNVHAEVKDVSGAFQRVPILLASALLTAIAITIGGHEYVAIPLVCMFGHYYSGFAWNVFARELQRQTTARGHAAGLSFPCCHLIVDDILTVGSEDFIRSDHPISSATSLAGFGALVNKKYTTTVQQALRVRHFTYGGIVYRLSPDKWDLRIVARRLAKIYLVLWVHIPISLAAGDRLSVNLIQRLFSYAYQLATNTSATYLRFFAVAIISQLRHQPYQQSGHIHLYHSTINAINYLRLWSINALVHPHQLLVSITKAPLLTPGPDETLVQLHERQQAAASLVIWSDASTDYHCIGVYIPNVAWAQFFVDGPRRYHINVLELLGMVMALSLLCHVQPGPAHIHRRSDSGVALAQTDNQSTNRSISLNLVLYDQTLQARHQKLLTQHHARGEDNPIADSASRDFTTPGSQAIRSMLHSTCRQYIPHSAWQSMLYAISDCSSMPISNLVQFLHTLPPTANMWTSAPNTSTTPLPPSIRPSL